MQEKIDKARKMISAWAVDVNRLRQLSEATGYTQVELLHEALNLIEQKLNDKEGVRDASRA
jgi:hypothetical protein